MQCEYQVNKIQYQYNRYGNYTFDLLKEESRNLVNICGNGGSPLQSNNCRLWTPSNYTNSWKVIVIIREINSDNTDSTVQSYIELLKSDSWIWYVFGVEAGILIFIFMQFNTNT